VVTACASAPPVAPAAAPAALPPAPVVPVTTWEEKIGWILRLEDERLIRDPNPPPPRVIQPATSRLPEILGPPPPSDLILLLGDQQARVRRRAALALGRVGLAEAVEPLAGLLTDEEFEVRQMAAFALGLVGEAAARPALLATLNDPELVVQGRAAEALGAIGDRTDADAIAAMVRRQVSAGVLDGLDPDDIGYPKAGGIEAVRLGVYALARLRAYDALASAILDGQGKPVSSWWPLAYALQRCGDDRATPAMMALLSTPGRFTPSFAVRGLAAFKAVHAADALREIVTDRTRHPAIVIQSIRALSQLGDRAAVPVLTRMLSDRTVTGALELEVMSAFGNLADESDVDLLLELVSDPAPSVRATAFGALARVDPATFIAALAGLDADPDWTVRVAVANALGGLSAERSIPRLNQMLQDRDRRVIPAVLTALGATRSPGVDQVLLDRLRSDDFMVRASAANALAEMKAAGAAGPLAQAYRASDGDSTYVARAAVLSALTRLDPAAARPVLEDALKDRDWAVRVRAAALLREQGATGLDQAIRPAPASRVTEEAERQALATPQFSPHAFIDTDKGTVEIELAILDAPQTVGNFMSLARKGFFNGVAIHRVVPDFVMQDGDPRGDGEGGPGYSIRDEINQRPYLLGTVGMALDWEDTGGSQFFVTLSPQPHLDGRYTVFGHVVNGMEVVDRLLPGDVVRRVRIWDGVKEQ
jgi:HEAT repeat protein/cyclophilin family peptidyl-prolyl cis-trans isomerase